MLNIGVQTVLSLVLSTDVWLHSSAIAVPLCSNPSAGSFIVSWEANVEFKLYYVQLSHDNSSLSISRPFSLQTTKNNSVVFSGLAQSTSYTVALRALPITAPSEAWGPAWVSPVGSVECKTGSQPAWPPALPEQGLAGSSSSSSKFMRVYRISEYSFKVDFLQNHDAASIDAMPLYLMTCTPEGVCSPFDAKVQSPKWDSCHETMASVCPNSRGAAFNCMKCADANRELLTASCGNWSDQDTLQGEGSFAVHFWCGVGWPESAAVQGPITEYCVEYQSLEEETRMGDGFSDYLSCNSDEVDGTLGNDPRDPSCVCIVWDDRLLAHQSNASWLEEDCYVGHMAWISETRCNCTGQRPKSPLPHRDNPSLTHVGRMPVWLPYVGFSMAPWVPGDIQIPSGYNYHFPKGGACGEGEALGTRGCTWRRLPRARMLYGADLLAQGWDLNFVADTPTNQTHTKHNIDVFKEAFKALDQHVKPMTCGPDGAYIIA